ncbi:cholesterol oxidase [Streptomyces mashuensis]|uniref:Cholesterol oxidase n=1 Tax=Streptomyces mashuensis TaxID=33904 RepID=A0A919B674_9ACTN|nr:GMC oxidoreductase [Streptomyces mashuensis]GHF59230.1 cholesterol oxidase [Streptomyces mashuensis]
MPSRRGFAGWCAGGALGALGASVFGAGGARARAGATARTHFRAVVVGSGFGGAVAALRLGEAGVDTLVLERGQEWPVSPHRAVFGSQERVDGRMFWFRSMARWPGVLPVPVRPQPGLAEVAEERHLDILCAAAVGGGSLVYTGATVPPDRSAFASLFPPALRYEEFAARWFPRAVAGLGATSMPPDVYASPPFTHSRVWDRHLRRAGHSPAPALSTFDWDVLRAELRGAVRPSAIAGETDFGCSDGAKKDLTRTYLPRALRTGHVQLRPLHEVRGIRRRRGGGFVLEVRRLNPSGATAGTDAYTCDLLFVCAGTLNTNRLLVAARERGDLPGLPAAVGTGFGTNGDQVGIRTTLTDRAGPSQGAPCASQHFFPRAYLQPARAESWQWLGAHGVPLLVTFLMTVDHDHRGTFVYDRGSGSVRLAGWSPAHQDPSARTLQQHQADVMSANPGLVTVGLRYPGPFTAHPLGGCVVGRCTDLEGRVVGEPGLYVLDGSLLPGNNGAANPSLMITALAERAMAGIVAAGG